MAKITPPIDKFQLELTQREIDLLAGILAQGEGNDNEVYNLYRTFHDHRKEWIDFTIENIGDGTDRMMLVRK